MSVGADDKAAVITLRTIRLVREELGANMIVGASNVSFGLLDRATINAAFLPLIIQAGASCAITDPLRMTPIIRAAELLLGLDEYAARFVEQFRKVQKHGGTSE